MLYKISKCKPLFLYVFNINAMLLTWIRHRAPYLLLLLLSLLFVTFYSVTTSFLYPISDYYMDSYVFQAFGKLCSQGAVPYLDLFDHKGPIIFYINTLGYLLCGTKMGVFLLQVISLSLALSIGYRQLRSYFEAPLSFFLILIWLISLTYTYEGGNLVEEYALPLLTLSFTCVYKWSKNVAKKSDYFHSPRYALYYGITIAFCLFTRLTNAVGIFISIAFITICLLANKQYKNLLANAVYLLGGICLLTVPIILYEWYKGALCEMWYATFIFNVNYALNSHEVYNNSVLSVDFFLTYLNCFLLVFIGIYKIVFNIEKISALLFIVLGGGSLIWFLSNGSFPHYATVVWPYLLIVLIDFSIIAKSSIRTKRLMFQLLLFLYVVVLSYFAIPRAKYVGFGKQITNNNQLSICCQLIDNIPVQERKEFVAYNCKPHLYLVENLTPCYKFFIFQDHQAEFSDDFKGEMHKTFAFGNARWILLNMVRGKTNIDDIINTRYSLVAKKNNFRLYKLSNS